MKSRGVWITTHTQSGRENAPEDISPLCLSSKKMHAAALMPGISKLAHLSQNEEQNFLFLSKPHGAFSDHSIGKIHQQKGGGLPGCRAYVTVTVKVLKMYFLNC